MPARVNSWWEGRITSLKANNPGFGAPRIRNALFAEYEGGAPGGEPVGPPPSEKWIGNFLRNLTEEQLRETRYFHWPDSLDRGDLPWEASAAALELLGIYNSNERRRPSVRLARWFWRVTVAAPDMPATTEDAPGHWREDGRFAAAAQWRFVSRYDAARLLASCEAEGRDAADDKRGIEHCLMFAPWRNEVNAQRYQDAIGSGEIPPFPRVQGLLKLGDPASEAGYAELFGELTQEDRAFYEKIGRKEGDES